MKALKPIKPYLLVVFGLAVFYGIGVGWGLKSEFSPSVDVPFPLAPLIFVGNFLDPTEASRYPAFHYLLQLPFYGAVMVFSMLTGRLSDVSSQWPYGFTDPVTAFSVFQVITRGFSLLMGIGLLLTLWKIRPSGTRPRSHLLALALLALSGPFTFYTREANLDIPYVFWWGLAVGFTWRYLFVTQKPRPDLMWAGGFAALSLATKDQAAGALFGLGIAILLISPEGQPLSWAQRARNMFLFGLCAAGVYGLAAVAPQPARWWYHLSIWQLNAPSVADWVEYSATPAGYLALAGAVIQKLASLLTPVGLILAGVGCYILVRFKKYARLLFFLLPVFSYLLMIIFNIRYVYERFMLPVAVVLVPVVGIGASYLAEHSSGLVRKLGFGLGVLGLALQFFVGYFPVTYMQVYDTKRQLAKTLDQYVRPGESLLIMNEDVERFPNADVYLRYRLMLPEGQQRELRSEQHLVVRYEPGAHCLLSSHPLTANETRPGMKLVTTWKNPEYVSRFVMKQVLDDFYLYDLDGKCQALAEVK